jgi:hypothetical protein
MSRIARKGSARRVALLVVAFAAVLALGLVSSSALAGSNGSSGSARGLLTLRSPTKASPTIRALVRSAVQRSAPNYRGKVSGLDSVLPQRISANSTTYVDPSGDTAGVDITTINVSNDDSGLITFQTAFPNRPTFTGDMLFLMLIDSDNNLATGDEYGDDYAIMVVWIPGQPEPAVVLEKLTGSNVDIIGGGALVYTNGVWTVSIYASDLGGTTAFSFSLGAFSGIVIYPDGTISLAGASLDVAPDSGTYLYQVLTGGSTTTGGTTTGEQPPPPKMPVSAARLAGRFDVVLRVTQNHNLGYAVGDTASQRWVFTPKCKQGPCPTTLKMPNFNRKALKRSGASYSAVLRTTYHCSSGRNVAGTVTVKLKVKSGDWINEVWRATSWSGTVREYTRGVSECGGAASATHAVRGSLQG